MKTFIVVLWSVLFFFNKAAGQSRTISDLIGRWEAVDAQNQSGGLEMVDSSTLFLVYGKEKKRVSEFKIDFTKSPALFDFTIKDESGSLQLKSLILFVNDELVQWQVFQSGVRPAHFTQGDGEMMYLRRKK